MHLLRTQPGSQVPVDSIADLGQTPAELVILCTGDSQLSLLAEVARQLPDDYPSLRLAINGHTDNSGSSAHNLQLSQQRAASVVAALVAAGIAAERLSAEGFGDSRPVADNSTAEGKAKNRRVELVRQ